MREGTKRVGVREGNERGDKESGSERVGEIGSGRGE